MTAPLIEVAGNPVPPGGGADFFRAADGLPLRYAVWTPEGAARGTILVFGGRTEFIEKYFEVIGECLGRGFCVASLDWRGQGLSGRELANPRKGHVADFAAFVDDLERFVGLDAIKTLPRPWIGLAHSMGGNILVRAQACRAGLVDGLVLSAPMLALRLGSPAVQAGLRLIARATCAAGFGDAYVFGGSDKGPDEEPFEQNIVTSDPGRHARQVAILKAEPRLVLGSPTFAWLKAAYESMDWIASGHRLESIRCPVLMGIAGEDKLVDPVRLRALAQRLPDADVQWLADSRHEILMERDAIRQDFWAALDRWLGRFNR